MLIPIYCTSWMLYLLLLNMIIQSLFYATLNSVIVALLINMLSVISSLTWNATQVPNNQEKK